MANLNSNERNVRKLSKVAGKSYAVTLPIELIRELGWKAKQKLHIQKKGQTLIVKDWEK